MHILAVGLSYHTAPVEIRDKVAFLPHGLDESLEALKSQEDFKESLILSTCNRSELYAVCEDAGSGRERLFSFFSDFHNVDLEELKPYLFCLVDGEAVRHTFSVACGLESMVMGEPQIAGQVKEAHQRAMERKTTEVLLNRLFMAAAEVSKRARTETRISEGPVSISFAAVELAKKVFDRLEGRTALLIGAGEMSELTAIHLSSNGISSIIIANRTLERAAQLAERIGAKPVAFQEGINYLDKADIVVSSTSAPYYVLGADDVARVMRRRNNNPIFFIDIAVPRDIDPEIGNLYNVFLYNIDDIESVVSDNLMKRQEEAQKARVIIDEELEKFLSWWGSLDVVPTIKSLREKFQKALDMELNRLKSKMDNLSYEQKEMVLMLMRGYMNKLLHSPTTRLKEAVNSNDGLEYVSSIRYLFDLDSEPKHEKVDSKE